MKKITTSLLIIIIVATVFFLLIKNKKPYMGDNVDLTKQESKDFKSDDITQSPEINDFSPSQRSIDGFFLGQHISVVKNTFGEPVQPDQIINRDNGETVYSYWLTGDGQNPTFIAFGLYNLERGIIATIQLTGEKSDRETFLGLKLGDSREKVINILGKPSTIKTGIRDGDFYIYDNRNYSVVLNEEGKLISIRIASLAGFPENIEIGDFIKDFTSALNTNDINKISEFLMPDVEIYVGSDIFKITKRFLDELSDQNSPIMKYLLSNQDSVKNILNNYNGNINMQLRMTEKGPSGYVYKFPDSNVLQEIFVVEQAGKYRVYEVRYRNSPREIKEPSYCLKILEQVNSNISSQDKWEAVEMNEIGGNPISVNNLDAKKFQEAFREVETQANYGPFLMERRETKDGEFIQETNPELIKCAQDRIIISTWQP